MTEWDSWGRKPEDDKPHEEKPPTPEDPDAGTYGWDDFPDWPVAGQPGAENPVYGQTSPRPSEETSEPPNRSHDPLSKLFPGLPHGTRVFLDWVLTIAGAILIVLAIKHWVVNPYRIPSSSMEPYLHCATPGAGCLAKTSDRVLACRICLDFSNPSRGDVVVFDTPSKAVVKCGEGGTFVKRLIGLPGESIREDNKGFIWIRGPNSNHFVKLNEPYISEPSRRLDPHHNEHWNVPTGKYFMLGDNRSQSCDSRSWGSVPRDSLIGTVFFTYWPLNRIGFK